MANALRFLCIFTIALSAAWLVASCASLPPGTRPAGAPTPAPDTCAYTDLVSALRAQGATVEMTGEDRDSYLHNAFSVVGQLLRVDGARVGVFEYRDNAAREVESRWLTPDGEAIRRPGGSAIALDWACQPNWWARGRIIVLYVGREERHLSLLTHALGGQLNEPGDRWANLPSCRPAVRPTPTATARPTDVTLPTAESRRVSLVYQSGEGLFVGGYLGERARQVVALPSERASARLRGHLVAFATESAVGLANLDTGRIEWRRDFTDRKPAVRLEVIWSADGQALAYGLTYEDSRSLEFGRSIEVGRLDLATGVPTPLLTLENHSGVGLYGFDQAAQRVYLGLSGCCPAPRPIRAYDTGTGREVGQVGPLAEGPVSFAPGLETVAAGNYEYGEQAVVVATDVRTGQQRQLVHPANTWAPGYLWSPDGQQVAFGLLPGRYYGDQGEGEAGLWLWRPGGGEPVRLDEKSLLPLYWSPEGREVLARAGWPGPHYLVPADGSGAKRRLDVPPEALILGWWQDGG